MVWNSLEKREKEKRFEEEEEEEEEDLETSSCEEILGKKLGGSSISEILKENFDASEEEEA